MSFWSRLADWILNNPRLILVTALVVSCFLGYWALQVQTDHTAGQFLSSTSKVVQDFERAGKVFGQSQTELYVVLQGQDPFEATFLHQLDTLTTSIEGMHGVERVLSLTNIPTLVRKGNELVTQRLYDPGMAPEDQRQHFLDQPVLRGLILSQDGRVAGMQITIEQAFNNTSGRVELVGLIEQEVKTIAPEAVFAGFPYLRSEYARRVTIESPLFTVLAVLISLAVLFLTFRARRAIFLPLLIVVLGIMWTLGLVALFGHRLNIVTAILPALLVIIGMANAIHLTTKFFSQYAEHQNLREALRYTVQTVGLATLLTCTTTAIGFGVLLLSGSRLLAVFGKYAAAGIMLLYILSITLIPLAFWLMKPPQQKASPLATSRRLTKALEQTARFTGNHSTLILVGTVALLVVGVIGASRISSDIYVFSDFKDDDPVRQDLAVFEDAFGGVLPLELVIEAKDAGRFRRLPDLRKLDRLQAELDELEPVGRTLSLSNLVKLSTQAYWNGDARNYRLPGLEFNRLQLMLRNVLQSDGDSASVVQQLPTVVDSTFAITRIYMGVEDIGTTRMNALADTAITRARQYFPPEDYEVFATGTALLNTRSGENLVNNLIISLLVALVLISCIMALLFRSWRLTIISLIPNIIPLLLVGGTMGFTGIILKPSTALIFPLAFGIAVDATIHFLAKYRLMRDMRLDKDEAIRVTMQETGKALLFATLVLMSGFLVFTLSSFGGTVNMGALTALTLALALTANLILLPALLYRFGPDQHIRANSNDTDLTP